MTNLDCSVANCTYNKDHSCTLDSIHIEGASARVTEDTCCESFVERKEGSSMNALDPAKKSTDVACEATTCIYNEECRCDAEHIGIAGRDACHCTDTECASFRCK